MFNIAHRQGNANQNYVSYHFTPIRMAIIKKNTNNSRQGCGVKGIHIHCWWKCNFVQPLWKAGCAVLSEYLVIRFFATPWTAAHQAPQSMGFPRQQYWSRLPFSSPGELPNPGIESRSPTLQADSLPSEPPGKPSKDLHTHNSHLLCLIHSFWPLVPGARVWKAQVPTA